LSKDDGNTYRVDDSIDLDELEKCNDFRYGDFGVNQEF